MHHIHNIGTHVVSLFPISLKSMHMEGGGGLVKSLAGFGGPNEVPRKVKNLVSLCCSW